VATLSVASGRSTGMKWIAIAAMLGSALAISLGQSDLSVANPDPLAPQTGTASAVFDIGVLVLREGLECILVLAAITAGLVGEQQRYRAPIAAGAGFGLLATLITWWFAVRILDDIGGKVSALQLQAATGLLAVIVLLVVMNWFFHKFYWTGWIGLHNRRKHDLLGAGGSQNNLRRLALGMGLLGFSSVYREGVEVVLFLQSYRLKLGNQPVYLGVLLGSALSGLVAVFTFVAHRKLPYRKMLVLTGVLLGLVLFVMVGEQAQEMQLAHWLPITRIVWLEGWIPDWMSLWFSVFPTVETLIGQALALVLVLGSYFVAEGDKASAGLKQQRARKLGPPHGTKLLRLPLRERIRRTR
jgi:high-affinity iron transporter